MDEVILRMNKQNIDLKKCNALVLGLTFKENCPDIRNTQVIKIIKRLVDYNIKYELVDPLADKNDVAFQYDLEISNQIPLNKKYSLIIVAVAHSEYVGMNLNEWRKFVKKLCCS